MLLHITYDASNQGCVVMHSACYVSLGTRIKLTLLEHIFHARAVWQAP